MTMIVLSQLLGGCGRFVPEGLSNATRTTHAHALPSARTQTQTQTHTLTHTHNAARTTYTDSLTHSKLPQNAAAAPTQHTPSP